MGPQRYCVLDTISIVNYNTNTHARFTTDGGLKIFRAKNATLSVRMHADVADSKFFDVRVSTAI